ncbi:50S ribosomal protein L33 [Pseudogracilibacillus sp. ICA-222130]|uniref:50S ribosomal protein L33 n=1 Tax=Pseudogracilibacillus sp. ICA-222130 TaxID=3134655 RepID=UPI004040B4FB
MIAISCYINIRKTMLVSRMNSKVILACAECSSRNYATNKNKLTSPERLEVKKYCKQCKKHVLHKETK